METSPHCTLSLRDRRLNTLWALSLTLAVLMVHGYHPFGEDGGLYVAGVQYTLNPALFPHETAFVTEHLRFSLFAPCLATAVKLSGLSLSAVLLLSYLLAAALTLVAGIRILEPCFRSIAAQRSGVALFAAVWTLPVAGTSLLLMDPYLTARSFALPLSLWAVSFTLKALKIKAGSRWRPYIACVLCLLAAAAFHPLMAGYGAGLVISLLIAAHSSRVRLWLFFAFSTVVLAACIQVFAPPETPPVVAASLSRYYWFLSQWHWYERFGLLGPLLILCALLRWRSLSLTESGRKLAQAAVVFGLLALTIALFFAQEHLPAHAVARLQPLRAFVLIYALMSLLLGSVLARFAALLASRTALPGKSKLEPALSFAFISLVALGMFFVQRKTFPASPHLELSGRQNHNPWVQAFLWARDQTPLDAVFALDARYINTGGEDAQTFRAIAQRSAIPDFSKDGGEAAISPALAPEWQRGALATRDLSKLTDAQRDSLLQPFAVDWVVLQAGAATSHPCPFRNGTVMVCHVR